MADAAVFALLKLLAPLIWSEVNLVIHSQEEVQKLADILEKLQKVLEDAEKQGVEDKSSLKELEDMSYEINDTLDEWEFKNLASKIEAMEEAGAPQQDFWEKVSSFVQSLCLCFNDVLERRRILLTIKDFLKTLDLITESGKREHKSPPNLEFKRRDTLPSIDVSEIHGRDGDKKELLGTILQSDQGVRIISVEGLGGTGKTTLAQIVFNDEKVKDCFDVKIWVCVSDPFDEFKIVRKILSALGKNLDGSNADYGMLLEDVEASISRKKFLLVLDDVWTEDETNWDQLKNTLKKGAPGSVILVTTRSERVSRALGTNERHVLKVLSDSDCWAIVSQKVFQGRDERECKELEVVGRKISKKCKGLPLAAKTLGGFLRNKNTKEGWNAALNDVIWQSEIGVKLFPHLYLSYKELPSAMKRCFSHCAVFPKDYRIEADELIRIWMAQGFLSSGGSREMELKGREFFDDLAMRSFFQEFEKDKFGKRIISCKMHDIVHDFAQHITKHECFLVETVDDTLKIGNENVRHLWWENPTYSFNSNCSYFCFDKLRSSFFNSSFDINLVSHLRRVRVLTLMDCGLEEIPEEIRNLIHLRYLNMSGNPIKELSQALFKLYNLQSLLLSGGSFKEIPREIRNLIHLRYLCLKGCSDLSELPTSLCELHNLRTLDISSCGNLSKLPQGISKLTKLRSIFNNRTDVCFPQELEKLTNLLNLSYLRVRNGGNRLGWLRNLDQLSGSLMISIDFLNETFSDMDKPHLENKIDLQELMVVCPTGSANVIEALRPNMNLESLWLSTCPLPGWITSLTNLRSLEIRFCNHSLPPLGKLPALEKLRIMWPGFTHLGAEFLGITKEDPPTKKVKSSVHIVFPKLKKLIFKYCQDWEVWEDAEAVMPCLEVLQISRCPKLLELPKHLILHTAKSLKELKTNSRCLLSSYEEIIRSRQLPLPALLLQRDNRTKIIRV